MTLALAAYRFAVTALAPLYQWHATRGLAADQQIERLGFHKTPRQRVIWCQAPSVGELDVLAPLMPTLQDACDVLVTTHSTTGAQKAAAMSPLAALAPIDTPAAVGQFLRTWQPKVAIFVESDMPPVMLHALAAQHIPYALIAARASKTRTRIPSTVAKLLRPAALITASTQAVAQELQALGLRVDVVEDLKSQNAQSPVAPVWAKTVEERPVWLAASTHPEDMDTVIGAHERILQEHPDALLLLAPRHVEASLDIPARLSTRSHTANGAPEAQTQVFVMDVLGQMAGLYAVAAVTYLGGGNGTRGGHSPWEAARAGNHVLTGPDTANNTAAFEQVPHRRVQGPEELARCVIELWQQPPPAPLSLPQGTATRDALLAVLAR